VLSTETATQDVKADRVKRLNEWEERIWRDGSYIQWVNPKTQKLHVKAVAEKIVGTKDISVFSKWAKPWRDRFNDRYKKKRKESGELLASCDADGQYSILPEDEAPNVLLDKFMESEEVKALEEVDEDALRVVLNSYQALSCERHTTMITKLQERVRRLEASLSRKDGDIDLLQENIEHYKLRFEREGVHHISSIRSIYSYEDTALCARCLKEINAE